MRKKITALLLMFAMLILTACEVQSVHVGQETVYDEYGYESEPEKILYTAMFYNNDGECYIGLQGTEFNISPNKSKQWGWNTDGHWESWYETSSVINIEVDGDVVPTSGSTVILMDSRIEMEPVSNISGGMYGNEAGSEYKVKVDSHPLSTYFGLTRWWYDRHEPGQGGAKIILIQSQNGKDIGIIEGDEVEWKIEEKLPKTTRIMVDDLPVYIHRANFMIIPRSLIEKSHTFMENQDQE